MKLIIYSILFVFFFFSSQAQGVWTQKADFPSIPRFDAFSFSIGDKGYIGAGSNGVIKYNDFWEYDAISNSWKQKGNFASSPRWQAVSFNIGLKGYVGTGQDNASAFSNDFWEYDITTDTWTQKASMPTFTRNNAVGFSIGSKGYIGTGRGGNPSIQHNDFWEYDTASNIWSQKANVPGNGRTFAVGLSIGMKGYIGTGIINGSYQEDFYEYDPLADIWVQKSSFPGGKRADIDGAHFIIGDYGYVGLGKDYANIVYNDFWKYNQTNDTWTQISNLTGSTRMGASAFSINNKGYICLGFDNINTCYNDLWEYTADSLIDGTNELKSEEKIILYHNIPNPFGNNTTIRYYIPENTNLHNAFIVFYDEFGREVKKVNVEEKGYGKIEALTVQLASGIYTYSLVIDEKIIDTKKMLRTK